jgi:hypothetical protein
VSDITKIVQTFISNSAIIHMQTVTSAMSSGTFWQAQSMDSISTSSAECIPIMTTWLMTYCARHFESCLSRK